MEIEIFVSFLIGFLFSFWSKKEILKRYINNYLIYFGLPFLILVSLIERKYQFFKEFALCVGFFVVLSSFLVYHLVKKIKIEPPKKSALFLCSTYGNFAYLGIPISFLFFGNLGATLSALGSLINGTIHYSLGIYLSNLYLKRKNYALKKTLSFPLLYGFIIAFFLSHLSISFPQTIKTLSKTAIYLAVFLVGISLKFQKFNKIYLWGMFFKFFLLPSIGCFLLLFFDLPHTYKLIFLFLTFTPPALANTLLSINFKFDTHFTAKLTFFGTLLFLGVVFLIKFFLL